MVKYVIKRLILAIITAFIVLSLTFILIKLNDFQMPLGTVQEKYSYFMKQYAQGFVVWFPKETTGYGKLLFSYDNKYFYQTPLFTQYFNWLKNILTKWEWGTSTYIQPNAGAIYIIASKLPVTISVNIWSTLISVPIGIALGIWAALKKNKPTDNVISTLVMVLVSIPSFVLITFLLLIFCYQLHWLPSQWPNPEDPQKQRVLGYILPVFVLSLGSICGYCRFTRAELCEVMESEYLLLARTKGLTKTQSITRHALRNAMVPIVPSILAEVIGLLSGSMILESLYGIPGIGRLYITAISSQDYNVLFVDMALFEAIGLVAGIFLDLSYGFIDPRIRMGAKNK